MTKKLTKNDSMSIGQHKFEVAASAFKALLYRRGLYQSYFQAWNSDKWREANVPADIAWENWAKISDPEEWVNGAFVWDRTSIPSSVWSALDWDWFHYCLRNLKK